MKKMCISNAKTKLGILNTKDDINKTIGAAKIGIAMILTSRRSTSVNDTSREDFITFCFSSSCVFLPVSLSGSSVLLF